MLPALPSNTSGNRLEVNNAGTNDFKVYIFFISSQEETIMNDLEMIEKQISDFTYKSQINRKLKWICAGLIGLSVYLLLLNL